ncbi:hypothetical protein FRC11_004426 [Ceratobasidium sp. 423]|nr:hypothetical protein FRC11_004426 [Ceratobasidium sp. 423]
MNEKYKQPPASRYIGAAAPGFNLEAGLSQTIQTTIQICTQQPLEDANVRTALLYLVERLAYQGIAIRTDLDLFSIYAHLKSMSTTDYAPPPEDVVGTRVMNVVGLAAFKAPVEWENRMELAHRIKVELHADILEVQLYYQELQQLSGNKLRARLELASDYFFRIRILLYDSPKNPHWTATHKVKWPVAFELLSASAFTRSRDPIGHLATSTFESSHGVLMEPSNYKLYNTILEPLNEP